MGERDVAPEALAELDEFIGEVFRADDALGRLYKQAPDVMRRAFARSGTTHTEVARRAGFSGSYLSQVMHGKRQPTIRFMERVMRALEVDDG